MSKNINHREVACQICGTTRRSVLRRGIIVRPELAQLIQKEVGNFDENGWICLDDLRKYRHKYTQALMEEEKGELGELELKTLKIMQDNEIISKNPEDEIYEGLTFGQRLADRIAAFGGSWSFIIFFLAVMLSWMFVNSVLLITHPFDPYPYILLNLALSGLAALQAPVIMMSQNRQESRDRQRALNDYQVNLKAELEIRQLNQKMDHLLTHQWERLMEIQSIQMEVMEELKNRR
jgi:uncharacterized membrane protein